MGTDIQSWIYIFAGDRVRNGCSERFKKNQVKPKTTEKPNGSLMEQISNSQNYTH